MFGVFNINPTEFALLVWIFLIIAVPAAVLLLGFSGCVAWQARRRGYSFFLWLLAGAVSLNPLLILVVLVMLPDARKKALRRQEMQALEAKLAAQTRAAAPHAAVAVPAASLGDQSTAAPSSLRSVGDVETKA